MDSDTDLATDTRSIHFTISHPCQSVTQREREAKRLDFISAAKKQIPKACSQMFMGCEVCPHRRAVTCTGTELTCCNIISKQDCLLSLGYIVVVEPCNIQY